MHTFCGALLFFATTPFAFGHVQAATSKEMLRAQFPAASIHHNGQRLAIEICWDETCDYYVARGVKSENEVWDVIFLHKFFYDHHFLAETFREKTEGHFLTVLAAYPYCVITPTSEPRAQCLVTKLAQRNSISYSFVRYDEGFRCEVGGYLVEPTKLTGKNKCTKVRHAP